MDNLIPVLLEKRMNVYISVAVDPFSCLEQPEIDASYQIIISSSR